MIRPFAAASAVWAALVACTITPLAAAADGDQTIRVQNGQIRCLLSTDYEDRGGPMAICSRTDGRAFTVAREPNNLAVTHATGETYFLHGTIPGPESADIVLGAGQTYRANGWTVTTEELRTLITYDIGGHGMRVNPIDVGTIWV